MKYVKLFDSYDKDEYWDKYLSNLNNAIKKSKERDKIDDKEYYKLLDDTDINTLKTELFTQEDIQDIQEVVSEAEEEWNIKNYYNVNIILSKDTSEIKIWKLEDEWYICGIGSKSTKIHYKCDQFEGLEKLLKSIFRKNPFLNLHK